MAKRDYYEVLGVDRGAAKDDIKRAYRKLAVANHPDRNPGDKAAEERFKEATEAYEILADEKRRQAYDQFGHAGVEGMTGGTGPGGFSSAFTDFEDLFGDVGGIFESLFGGTGSLRSLRISVLRLSIVAPTESRRSSLRTALVLRVRAKYSDR